MTKRHILCAYVYSLICVYAGNLYQTYHLHRSKHGIIVRPQFLVVIGVVSDNFSNTKPCDTSCKKLFDIFGGGGGGVPFHVLMATLGIYDNYLR